MMYCRSCNSEKDESEFPNNRCKTNGKGNYCNACMYHRLKEWRGKNKDKLARIQKNRYERLKGGTSTPICQE